MKKLFLMGALLLAGLGVLYTFRSQPAYTNFPPQKGKVWVAFGDSLTSGYGASDGHDYPAQLSQRLRFPILNLGAPGQTSQDALGRVDEVLRVNPGVVLLCFGGNDTLNQVPASETFHNLAEVIDRLQAGGAFVVLIGVHSASVRDKYHAQFKKLAQEKHALFVPNILGGVLGNPGLMSDYVHPNDEGYSVIAARLEKTLQPLLPQLAPN